MKIISILKRLLNLSAIIILAILLLGAGGPSSNDLTSRVRAFTRDKEFNFVEWTIDALGIKLNQLAVGSENYLTADQRHQLVTDYLELVYQMLVNDSKLQDIYSDPKIEEPEAASSRLRQELSGMRARRAQVAPVAEAILQEQVSEVASELNLTLGGQPIPPVMFHSTPLPWALIVSPRETIDLESDINLTPELTIDQQVKLEEKVDQTLDVSSLVVGIGGIGLYPTMVDETFNLTWLSEVVGHEWVHNFLTLRPLGLNYMSSPELRTMNETAASIAGKEIGQAVIEKYYPELLPKPELVQSTQPPKSQSPAQEEQPPAFDFYQEMHQTRVEVDRLLAEGKVDDAEQYMEQRRAVFWENGYHIRKLNQAWFAFNGAYADQPGGGAAGEDPVGAAVRALRAQSASLTDFLKQISWMSSFDQLQRAVESDAKK
jgi:hypothetical protein